MMFLKLKNDVLKCPRKTFKLCSKMFQKPKKLF